MALVVVGKEQRVRRMQVGQAGPRRAVSVTVAEQRAHLAREVVEVVLFVGLVLLIVHFAVNPVRVQDASMAPVLQSDQEAVVNRLAYLFGAPARGDVVLVADPRAPSRQILRRIIAGPGDTVTLTATEVIVDGVTLKEPYVTVPNGQAQNDTVLPPKKLKAGQYFVLPDQRLVTGSDSRDFGVVPAQNIQGKAVFVFWPVSAFHWIAGYPQVFAHVHGS